MFSKKLHSYTSVMQLDRNIFGEDIVLGSLTIASRDEYKILDQIHNEQICSKFYCEEYFF